MPRFLTTVLLLGTLAFLAGCSRNPMSPTSPTNGGAMPMGIQTDDPSTEVSGGTPAVVTGTFDATSEARLTVGRFTLDLHKNTLKMPATITMRVPTEDALNVEITVEPAEANDFQVPAQLWANMSDKPETNYETAWMWYLENNDWEEWTDVAAHPFQQNVVAHMQHLADCRVGDHVVVPEDTRGRK